MADALYEDGGGFLTADGTMTLAFGRAWGGSTVVYTGTSLIAPERVLRGWDVPGLAHADVERRSRKFMGENNVHLLPPELINDNNRLFVEGCEKAGFHAEQFPLNLKGCLGSSLCNLGCPNGAKQGTHARPAPGAPRRTASRPSPARRPCDSRSGASSSASQRRSPGRRGRRPSGRPATTS